MAVDLLKLSLLLLIGNAVVYTGVFFISGQLFPNTLASVYQTLGPISRWALAGLFIILFGNSLFAYAYAHFDPALATPINIFSLVLVLIAMTILILGIKPSIWIIPATLLVAGSCAWVQYILNQASS